MGARLCGQGRPFQISSELQCDVDCEEKPAGLLYIMQIMQIMQSMPNYAKLCIIICNCDVIALPGISSGAGPMGLFAPKWIVDMDMDHRKFET